MKRDTLLMADRARGMCGFPWHINSGFRTKQHNDSLKDASKTSSHMKGYAFDVRCIGEKRRFDMVKAGLAVGFHRIGIYDTFIHFDNDPNKAPRIWKK